MEKGAKKLEKLERDANLAARDYEDHKLVLQ